MTISLSDFDLDLHFSSAIYRCNLQHYLPHIRPVVYEYVNNAKSQNTPNKVYPATMTDTMHHDERMVGFRDDVLSVAWQVLDSQGYFMDPFFTTCTAMWVQNHPTTSSMDYHIHGDGNQLNAFYFVDSPDNSIHLTVHDPRSAKNIINLPIKQIPELTMGHNMLFYTPKPGDLFITNSWLPHSFTRNASKEDVNFIHMNINVFPNPNYRPACATEPIVV